MTDDTQTKDPSENFDHALKEMKDAMAGYLHLVRLQRVYYSLSKIDNKNGKSI